MDESDFLPETNKEPSTDNVSFEEDNERLNESESKVSLNESESEERSDEVESVNAENGDLLALDEPPKLSENYNSTGLTAEEVENRINNGKINGSCNIKSKSFLQILKSNVCTLFNLLNFVLFILTITLGKSFKNSTFIGPAVINLIIGIVQEVKAKHTIDKLNLISAPKVTVIRDGAETEIKTPDIVLDDLMVLSSGNQICSDSVVLEGTCEVNESLITGESDPIVKKEGDELLSGSYLVSGKVKAKVVHVGNDNYATKITKGAKYVKETTSDILKSLRMVIRIMSFVVVPLGILLFLKSYFLSDPARQLSSSIIKMVSSMSSMIPQGLIALTSTIFAVGVIRLSKYKTLSQDLYCIETLARVDVLCLDKTGTITEGSMQVDDVNCVSASPKEVDEALTLLANLLPDSNPTYNAIRERYPQTLDVSASFVAPFSSARKWSGISIENKGTFIMGAPEFVLGERVSEFTDQLEYYTEQGERVLVLVRSKELMQDTVLPENIEVMGLIIIGDKIRKEAPDTLQYFRDQNVDIRIISGDNHITVSAIAKKAGLVECDAVDMTTVADEDIQEVSRKYKIFGRVTPDQKLKLVKALKSDGHTVGMTGDGVNDVLALKEADCSIAMASGSDAARNASQLVLLDSNFASMPKIVAEGRRSINNLQRTAALYLIKTIYSALLTLLFIFIPYPYPYEPANITLVGAVTIGIPSFILALEPNKELVKGRFLPNVLSKSLPGGISIVVSVAMFQIIRAFLSGPLGFTLTEDQMTTVSVVLLAFGAFVQLFIICMPFDVKHVCLYVGMIITFFLCWLLSSIDLVIFGTPVNIFSMTPMNEITSQMWIYIAIALAVSVPCFILTSWLIRKYVTNKNSKLMNRLSRIE